MKRFLLAAIVAAAATQVLAADVGVSVSIGQPGFYGRIDVGGYPPPQFIYQQPRYIEAVPYDRPPIYLRVPPGHAKHWGKHCREYDACGERVYFVQDRWYSREYAPRYREANYGRRDERRDERHEDRRDDRRGDRDDRGDHDNGRHGGDHDRGRNH